MAFISERVGKLQPYLFSEFQKRKLELEKKGIKVIDLGIGAPDLATPDFILNILLDEAKKPHNHRYSPYQGIRELKEAVAYYYRQRYQVEIDPETEVVVLIGSKEGIAHLVQATINPNEVAIVPNPGYPVYQNAIHLAGGMCENLPLDPNNNFQPLFEHLPETAYQQAKLMFLNYPSNPTAGTVDINIFGKAVTLAREFQFIIAHDAAYDLMTFGNYQSPSILQVPNAKEYAIEFGSLSKSFNMTGWRIGYAVGNQKLIHALSTLKSNIDTSQFLPIQKAAAAALTSDLSTVKVNNGIFEERMKKMVRILNNANLTTNLPQGTFYLWVKIPDAYTSVQLAHKLLDEAGIIVTPGTAFGTLGEGYIRISATVDSNQIDEIEKRLQKIEF